MKAVLVIDMPTRCDSCYLVEEWFNEYGEKVYYCPLYKMNVSKNGDVCEKLRPLPRRLKKGEMIMNWTYEEGYNDCLEEITGETDESNISD